MSDLSIEARVKPRTAALTAGAGMVLMTIIAAPANFAVIQGMVVPGDAVATAANLTASAGLFRLGAVGLLVAAVLDVVVAWGLYEVFRATNSGLSLIGAWFRLAYAAVFAIAIVSLFGAVRAAATDAAVAYRFIGQFNDGWMAGQVLFGIHLGIVGVLALRAPFIHWLFGLLLLIAGAGYLVDGVTALAVPGLGIQLATFTFVGELALMLWLLIRGPRLAAS